MDGTGELSLDTYRERGESVTYPPPIYGIEYNRLFKEAMFFYDEYERVKQEFGEYRKTADTNSYIHHCSLCGKIIANFAFKQSLIELCENCFASVKPDDEPENNAAYYIRGCEARMMERTMNRRDGE